MKLAALLVFTLAAFAADKKGGHTHSKTQKAHDHGAAEVNLAVEGHKVDIEFHAPAMAIVGFEYVPSSAADKKKQAAALAALKSNITKMVLFDAAAGCKLISAKTEVEQEEPDHAAIDGDFVVNCTKPMAESKVSFAVTKMYPGITSVKVQAVGASGSTGADIKSDKGIVTLPR